MRAAMGMKKYVQEAEVEKALADLPNPNHDNLSFEQFINPQLQRALSIEVKYKWSYGRTKSHGRTQSRGLSAGSPGGASKGVTEDSAFIEKPPVKLSRPMQMTANGKKLTRKVAGLTRDEQYMLAMRNCREIKRALDEIPEKQRPWMSSATRGLKKEHTGYDRWIPEPISIEASCHTMGTSYMSPTMSPRSMDLEEGSFGSPSVSPTHGALKSERLLEDIPDHDIGEEHRGFDSGKAGVDNLDAASDSSLDGDIPPIGSALGVPIGSGVKITSKPLLKMKAEAPKSVGRSSTPPTDMPWSPMPLPTRAKHSKSMKVLERFTDSAITVMDSAKSTTMGAIEPKDRRDEEDEEEETTPALRKQMSLGVVTLGFFGRPPKTADGLYKRRRASIGSLAPLTLDSKNTAPEGGAWDVVKHKLLFSPTRSLDGSDLSDEQSNSERSWGPLRKKFGDRVGGMMTKSTEASPRTPKSSFVPRSVREWSQGSTSSEVSDVPTSARRMSKSRGASVRDLLSPTAADSGWKKLRSAIELPGTPTTSVSSMKRRDSYGTSDQLPPSPTPINRSDVPTVSGRRNESEGLAKPQRRKSISDISRRRSKGSILDDMPVPVKKARRSSRVGSYGSPEEESGNWGPVLLDNDPLEIDRKWKASGMHFKKHDQVTDLLQSCLRQSLEKSFVAVLGLAFDSFNNSSFTDDDFKAFIEIFMGKAEENESVPDMLQKSYKVPEESILAKTSRTGGGYAVVVKKILGEVLDKNDFSVIKEKMSVFEEEHKKRLSRKAHENELAMKNVRIKQIMLGRHRLVVKELSLEERPDFGFRNVKEMQMLLRYCVRNRKDEAFGDLFRSAASLVEARYIHEYIIGKSENHRNIDGCFGEMVGVKDLDHRTWSLTIFAIWWACKTPKAFLTFLFGGEYANREGLCAFGQMFSLGEIPPVSVAVWLMEQDVMERRPETSGSMNRLLTHVPVIEMELDTENFLCECVDRTRFNRRSTEDVEAAVRNLLHRSDRRGRTMLHFAVEYGSTRLFELMFQLYRLHSIEVNIRDNYHTTPIHLAMERDDLKIVKILIMNGANPNILDKGGNTPMHYGAAAGRTNLCLWLANEGGGDPSVNNYSGMSPHNSAMDTNMEETATALIGLNAKRTLKMKESMKVKLEERRKSNISLLPPSPKQQSFPMDEEIAETKSDIHSLVASIRGEMDAGRRKSVQFAD